MTARTAIAKVVSYANGDRVPYNITINRFAIKSTKMGVICTFNMFNMRNNVTLVFIVNE